MDKGSILILSLVVMSVLLVLAGTFLSLTVTQFKLVSVEGDVVKARWIAKAGANQILYDIRKYYFDDPDKFKQLQYDYIAGVDFGEGMFKAGMAPTEGLGVREMNIAAEGFAVSTNEYSNAKQIGEEAKLSKQALIMAVSITCPTDFLFFFNGNGALFGSMNINEGYWVPLKVYGPVHANGSIFIDSGSFWDNGTLFKYTNSRVCYYNIKA